MMGQFKTKAAMRSYAKIAQEITDIIHAPQNQKETPRVAHIKDKKMTTNEIGFDFSSNSEKINDRDFFVNEVYPYGKRDLLLGIPMNS